MARSAGIVKGWISMCGWRSRVDDGELEAIRSGGLPLARRHRLEIMVVGSVV